MEGKLRVAIVGAGPVGSLAALYAANRGHSVEIYELRGDLRDPSTIPLNFTKSINLALSERGLNAMRHADQPNLVENVLAATIPMRGRMIHRRTAAGALCEEPQDYDPVHGNAILAIDRGGLNKRLLDILEAMPNVKFFFNHKLTGADFKQNKAWFEVRENGSSRNPGDRREIEISFDLMLGCDGAHSAVRYHMMKFTQMDYQQTYVPALWCEFQIKPKESAPDENPMSRYRISPNHLHIWPAKEFMFIAIPGEGGAFVCTLFAPPWVYSKLESDPTALLIPFFDEHFPGVTQLIPPEELISSFQQNPHLPLISIKCKPYHYGSSVVILGDAAHAMVPFYGQGMNAGLESVRILFDILDKHARMDELLSPDSKFAVESRARALEEYTAIRVPDAHAINDMALNNYEEMRAKVLSRKYLLRKWLEEKLSKHAPWLGWQTQYSRVSFSNQRYSEVKKKSQYQGDMLVRGFMALVGMPVLAGAVVLLVRYKRAVDVGLRAALGSVDSMVELMTMKL